MAILTKKDFDEPLVPERCKDCEHLRISHAMGLTRKNRHPIATCKLNPAIHRSDKLRGTYEPCSNVIFLSAIYKCKYDKERLA